MNGYAYSELLFFFIAKILVYDSHNIFQVLNFFNAFVHVKQCEYLNFITLILPCDELMSPFSISQGNKEGLQSPSNCCYLYTHTYICTHMYACKHMQFALHKLSPLEYTFYQCCFWWQVGLEAGPIKFMDGVGA